MEPLDTEDEICSFDYLVFKTLKLDVEQANKMTLYELYKWLQYAHTNNTSKISTVNRTGQRTNIPNRQSNVRPRIQKVKQNYR